jgi:hypothetical protein
MCDPAFYGCFTDKGTNNKKKTALFVGKEGILELNAYEIRMCLCVARGMQDKLT